MWMFIKRLATINNTLEKFRIPKIYLKLQMHKRDGNWPECNQTVNINDIMWWFYNMKNH